MECPFSLRPKTTQAAIHTSIRTVTRTHKKKYTHTQHCVSRTLTPSPIGSSEDKPAATNKIASILPIYHDSHQDSFRNISENTITGASQSTTHIGLHEIKCRCIPSSHSRWNSFTESVYILDGRRLKRCIAHQTYNTISGKICPSKVTSNYRPK